MAMARESVGSTESLEEYPEESSSSSSSSEKPPLFDERDFEISEVHKEFISLQYTFSDKCHGCKSLYNSENPPYNIKCGHSVCLKCIETCNGEIIICYKCATEIPIKNSVLNVNLLKQVERVQRDKILDKDIKNTAKERVKDPFLFCISMLQVKTEHFMFLKHNLFKILESLKTENMGNPKLEEFTELIRDFNEGKQDKSVASYLRELADLVEGMEERLKGITSPVDVEDKVKELSEMFFKKFKHIDIFYDFEVIKLWSQENVNIFTYKIVNGTKLYGRVEVNEVGLHVYGFQKQEPPAGILISYSQICTETNMPKNVFLDFEARLGGFKYARRIYIDYEKSYDKMKCLSLFTGEENGKCLKNFAFFKLANLLITNYETKLHETVKKFVSSKSYVYEPMVQPGLVYIAVKKHQNASLQVMLHTGEERKSIPNVLGFVTSGLYFLRAMDTCSIVNCGVNFDLNK